jgi:hypothetical protein
MPRDDEYRFDDEAETEIRPPTSVPEPTRPPGSIDGAYPVPNDNTIIRRKPSDASLAWLIPTSGPHAGRMLRVGLDGTVIGREARACQIVVSDEHVSGMHAKIRSERIDGRLQFNILDMGSANGTFVDNVRIDRCRLRDGAHIRLGKTEFVFKQSTI